MDHQGKLGKYRVIRKLGQGATSEVYLAFDPFAEKEVAIKVLRQEMLDNSTQGKVHRRMLHAEASLAGKLSHPHIVTIYDAVITDEISYVVMEYIKGSTLEKHVEPDGLREIQSVVEILFKCCRALNYAQFYGVIHRDIKPANILLTDRGEPKISDLGAAIILDLEQTRMNNIGSPSYMSPEQISGETLTHQTDIYSLGVVMYRMLTGRSPYTAKTLAELCYQINNSEFIPPRSLRPNLPVQLEGIVLKAMKKSLHERYQDWKDFGADLASFGSLEQHHEPTNDTAKFTTLRKMPFFCNFTDVELWEILRISEWQFYPEKAVIVHENGVGEDFFIITEGTATVTKLEKLLNTIHAGESFGEMAYVTGKNTPRSATITASTNVSTMKVSPHNLLHLSDSCQLHFVQAFLKIMTHRLRETDTHIASLIS